MSEISQTVAIIGFGIIGQSWSIAFARAGFRVRVFDTQQETVLPSIGNIQAALDDLSRRDLLHQQPPETVLRRISVAASISEAVSGTVHVQENTPENAEVKSRIFAELDALAPPMAVLASSTSALLPSQFCKGLSGAERCLVAHPLNPPHLIPAVELVPNSRTTAAVVEQTYDLMCKIGQAPIVARREIPGFIMNRLQGAILDEAFALVDEGLCSVEDVDRAVRDGLSRRWGFMGPFETIDLNAPGGVEGFIDRYREAYEEIGKDRPNRRAWTGALREKVTSALRNKLPVCDLTERQAWRDRQLARLAAYYQQDRTE